MPGSSRPLAVVTGASTGIGYELAKCCAENGFDLVVAADEAEISKAAKDFEAMGAKARSRCPRGSRTSRRSFSPISSPPATWRQSSATSRAATRSRCGAAARSGSSRSAAPSCWAQGGDRDRHGARAPGDGKICGRRDARFHAGGHLRLHPGADLRPRRRCLHRRGRDRAAHDGELRFHPRPGEGCDLHGNRSPARGAAGDSLLPELRHGLGRRRLRRLLDKIPMGSAINRGLTFRMAQTPVQHYMPKLLALIEEGKIDPSFVVTDRARLEDGPMLYQKFRDKTDGCIKVVMTP